LPEPELAAIIDKDMKEYTVKVYDNGTKTWYMNGKRHREDGPAIEEADGSKEWYINGEGLTEEEFNKRTKQPKDCDGLTVTIDGVEYRLSKVK